MGWKCYYTPSAVAYHYRSYLKSEDGNIGKMHAVKNRYLLYLKNEMSVSFLKDLFRNMSIEIFRLFRYILMERDALFGVKLVISHILHTLKKRALIMKRVRVERVYIESWYANCSQEIVKLEDRIS